MNEIGMLKKKIREIEAPLKEIKTFQLGYLEIRETKSNVFHVESLKILQKIVPAKEAGKNILVKPEKEKV